MADRLRVGIVGSGRIGAVHARTLAYRVPEAEVVAIADPNQEAARRLAGELGVRRTSADYREITADSHVEAVLVCSSTDTHASVVTEAAKAGKHVFCEKPLDLDLARVDAVLAATERARVKLQVGFNRRFDPDFASIRRRIAGGEIGAPELLRITSRDPRPPPVEYVRVSGGMFLDMTIHDFDMARFLLGEVEEVYVSAANRVDPRIGAAGDVDTAVVVLRFASGALGTIDNSRRAVYGYDQRVEVFGSKGVLFNANRTPDTVVAADSTGVRGPLPLDFFMQRYADAYEAEIRAFVRCVRGDETPPATGADGRRALVLACAAKKSLAEHRPVEVSEIG